MALVIKAKLNSRPEATVDGSGMVAHDLYTVWIRDEQEEKQMIHKTVDIPYATLQDIASVPGDAGKVGAYIQAFRDYFFTQRVPLTSPRRR